MQQFKGKSLDFDTWASAVRQQMLDSLARRRNAHPKELNDQSGLSQRERNAEAVGSSRSGISLKLKVLSGREDITHPPKT